MEDTFNELFDNSSQAIDIIVLKQWKIETEVIMSRQWGSDGMALQTNRQF